MATSLNPVNMISRWAGASDQVVQAIKNASTKTGVSFDYLMNKAKQESSFNPTAKAGTSSATGLFQFIDSTWLQAVRSYGDQFGIGNLADKITVDNKGRPQVTDENAKRQILELRKDPAVAANMTAAMSKDNASYLENSLGNKVGEGDLYLAHFLGLGGAEKFLKAKQTNAFQAAADIFPAAAAANKNVFYDASGRKKSLDEVSNFFAAKMDSGNSSNGPITLVAAADSKGKTVHLPSMLKPAGQGFTRPLDTGQVDVSSDVLNIGQRQLLESLLSGIHSFGVKKDQDGNSTGGNNLISPYTSYILAKLKSPDELANALNEANNNTGNDNSQS